MHGTAEIAMFIPLRPTPLAAPDNTPHTAPGRHPGSAKSTARSANPPGIRLPGIIRRACFRPPAPAPNGE